MHIRSLVRSRLFWLAVVVAVAGGAAAAVLREPRPDTQLNGAYRLDDGRLVVITPSSGHDLRCRAVDGTSSLMLRRSAGEYDVGTAYADRAPVTAHVHFSFGPGGRPSGLVWTASDGRQQRATRLELVERNVTFPSGEITLRARLVLPPGPGPHPAVVLVHGSEDYSGVDMYAGPYFFAPNGIATLVYDKRGTGGSEGHYTQNFHVLARDVLAAVRWLRTQPDIDPDRIHLAGGSQGGWIAPLAAADDGHIRSVLVEYGPAVPVTEEDRWGYVYALRRRGFDGSSIAEADAVNDIISDIIDRGRARWGDLGRALDAAAGRPWAAAAVGSDSALGMVIGKPVLAMRLYAWWSMRPRDGEPFIDRLYDPVPTLQRLASPSLWLLAGEDSSLPTPATVAALERVRAEGRPIEIHVFPATDHGILRFDERPDGSRHMLRNDPGFRPAEIEWLRRQSGLPVADAGR